MRHYIEKYPGARVMISFLDLKPAEAHAIILPSCHKENVQSQIKSLVDAAEKLEKETGLTPVYKRYLLSDTTNQIHLLPAGERCARTVVQQSPLDGSKAALLIFFKEDSTFKEISEGVWGDRNGRVWIGDTSDAPGASSLEMTEEYLRQLSKVLASAGGNMRDHCLRTWFFVRDIDNNYSGVVKGRNNVFAEEGLTSETHFIASTGIAGQSHVPSRLVSFSAFSDTCLNPHQVRFLYGSTHLNPTYEYGVAFERGTLVEYGDRAHVYVSGTASIDNRGEIVAPGDIVAQTSRMLENIEVLFSEGGCGWDDVAHLIVYLRDVADHDTVKNILSRRFTDIPVAIVLAPVCRPGWLIEAECMALQERENPEYEPY